MIRKSIITALALLVAYHFILPRLPHRFFHINGQQRGNYQRAQQYLLDAAPDASVLLGSSMAMELNDELLGPEWRKLTFPGGSLFTGLEIIDRAHRHPPVVLIETNVLNRDEDPDLLADLFSPVLTAPRRHSTIFREEGRPSNFIEGFASAAVEKTCRLATHLTGHAAQDTTPSWQQPRLTPALFEEIMHINRVAYSETPPATPLAQRVARLGAAVDHLHAEGCRCIFFEMPMDATLTHLPGPEITRHAVEARFPATAYDWLEIAGAPPFETRDGVHLTHEEADRLTRVIVRQVHEMVNTGKHDGHYQSSPSEHYATARLNPGSRALRPKNRRLNSPRRREE